MAKHFKTDADQPTTNMRRVRPSAPLSEVDRVRADDAPFPAMPYGEAGSYRTSYAQPLVNQDFYEDELPARGGIRAFARGIVLLLAWVVRLGALALFVLLMLNVLSLSPLEIYVDSVTDAFYTALPWPSLEILSVDTPFGGTFFGDMAIMMLVLFVVDTLLCKLRRALR